MLACKYGQIFDSQADISKQGDSPDYEFWRQLWELLSHGTIAFQRGGLAMEFFEEKEPNRLHRLTEWAVDCAVMVALACYLVFCFGSRVEMNGSSMKPVLESGDVVLMNRLSYDIGKPNRLDVVVFEREGQQPGIKRIIGLPGETVQIKNGSIYVNGELLKAQDGLGEATIAGAAEYPVELGDDEYFLLGDNRESSEDSRFSGIGNIKRENLIGRVWLRFQPFSRLGFVR